jgi:hypothetical protein
MVAPLTPHCRADAFRAVTDSRWKLLRTSLEGFPNLGQPVLFGSAGCIAPSHRPRCNFWPCYHSVTVKIDNAPHPRGPSMRFESLRLEGSPRKSTHRLMRCVKVLRLRRGAAAALIAFIGLVCSAHAEPLTIQGSTTFNRRLMEPYLAEIEMMTGQQLTVIPNKSTPGLIALLEGRAHMAMISAPLDTEVALVRKVMPGLAFEKLRAFEIDRTRVAFAVNRANPVRAATLDQIADMMLGKITNWNEL